MSFVYKNPTAAAQLSAPYGVSRTLTQGTTFSISIVGGSINTTGGFIEEYPVTTPVIEIEVTIPEVINEIAVEVVDPMPIGF